MLCTAALHHLRIWSETEAINNMLQNLLWQVTSISWLQSEENITAQRQYSGDGNCHCINRY